MPPESNIPAPELKKINFKKPPAHIVVLIAFAIVLGVLQIYFIKNPDLLRNTYPSVLDKKNLTVDPISDWKTYRNEEYGFEFQYPNNLEIIDLDQRSYKPFQLYIRDHEYYEEIILTIETSGNMDPAFLEEYGVKTTRIVRFEDKNWFEFLVSESGIEPYDIAYYQITVNDTIYKFGVHRDMRGYKEILSTFKFISTSTQSVNASAMNCSDYKDTTGGDYEPGEVLVSLKSGADKRALMEFIETNDLQIISDLEKYGLIEVRVPNNQEQCFANAIKLLSGVDNASKNYRAQFDI